MDKWEAAHLKSWLESFKPRKGRTLIVGSKQYGKREDRRKAFPNAVGLDMLEGKGVDIVHDLTFTLGMDGQFAHVECWSVLEHCQKPWKVAKHIVEALEPGGTIALSVPFIWRVHGYPSDYFRFTTDGIRALFEGVTWDALEYASNGEVVPFPRGVDIERARYMPRTEVFGFGRRA